MFGHTFYHGTIRRYVVLFGTLFNDIHITHPDTTRNQTRTIKVPVSYGPKEKVLARLTADPNLDRMPAIVVPRISFEITDVSYASDRKLTTVGKKTVKDTTNPDKLKYQYNPVPYDINFALSVIAKNTEDASRIVEQILPFFTPDWTATLEIIPEMDVIMDIPIVLNTVSVSDTYEGDFEQRRAITWDMRFTLKGYLFGPVRKSGIIKVADVNFFDGLGPVEGDSALANIDIRPGLLANGSPTTNAELTVDTSQIEADDNYAYIITKTDY